MPNTIEQILYRLVSREIHYCVSSLVEKLASSGTFDTLDSEDQETLLSIQYQDYTDETGEEQLHESLEHWIVSDWFAEKLQEHGEMVGQLLGMTIWGRACSGQSITCDSVIHDIANDMGILPGQSNSWE